MFKAQKGSKNIVRIVHFISVVQPTFLGLEHGSCVAVYGRSESSRTSLNLCSEDELRSYGFGTTRG